MSQGTASRALRWTRAAAHHGLVAALLAAEGAEAAPAALEGERGFYRGFLGCVPDVRSTLAELGSRFRIMDVLLKPFPGCVYAIAPTAAVLELLGQYPVRPKAVEQLVVELNPADAQYPGMAFLGPFRSAREGIASGRCTARSRVDSRGRVR